MLLRESEVLVPMDRVLEFANELAQALRSSSIVLAAGLSGSGKSVLAKAFTVISTTPRAIFVEPDWEKASGSPPEKTLLDVAVKTNGSLCFIDEPHRFLNLAEFLAIPGEPVVLLVQDISQARQCIGGKADTLPVVEVIPFDMWEGSRAVAIAVCHVAKRGAGHN